MKKVLLIIAGVLVLAVASGVIWYNVSLGAVSKNSEEVNFTIESGAKTKDIVADLKTAGLIKNESAAMLYLKLHKNILLRTGTYKLNRNQDVESIMARLNEGGSTSNTTKITFKEGYTLEQFVEQIADATNQDKDELLKEINSKEFLEPLIEEYWFLTDEILNEKIYNPLEGYLYPNTYEIYKNASLTSVVKKMLSEMNKKLDPYKIAIKESKYSVHELLTMAAIIENEATSDETRAKISQVIYKRLSIKMSLGMDVTSYYGVHKTMKDPLLKVDLDDDNPYNTRRSGFIGLPIGPICNPSISSIKAALNPADTDYVYFVADMTTREVYFAKDEKEFAVLKEKYMK